MYEDDFTIEDDDFASLMEEPPGGHNHGRMDGYTLDTQEMVTADFRYAGGFGIAHEGEGGTRGNPRTNDAILGEDEFVDEGLLRRMVEEELGFDLDLVRTIYSSKYLSPDLRATRTSIDARILELYESGANMNAFSRVTGIHRQTMDRARQRAQSVRADRTGRADRAA